MISITKKDKQLILLLLVVVTFVLLKNTKHDFTHLLKDDENTLLARTRFLCSSHETSITADFENTTVINHFKFAFPINIENRCENGSVEIVMPVHSALENFNRRERMRRISQGQYTKDKSNRVLMLFFVGEPSWIENADYYELQNRLHNESKQFGDIIQVNVHDKYQNVAYKSIAVLQWILQHCPEAEHVIKTDDDVVVYVPHLILSVYKAFHVHSDFIIGEVVTNRRPVRSKRVKWYVPMEEFANDTYPPHVSSPAMGYPISTALSLYRQALRTRLMRLHDVFLTGICAKKLGIPLVDNRNFAFVHRLMRDPDDIYVR